MIVKSQYSLYIAHSNFIIGFIEGMMLYILIREKNRFPAFAICQRRKRKKTAAVFLLEIQITEYSSKNMEQTIYDKVIP